MEVPDWNSFGCPGLFDADGDDVLSTVSSYEYDSLADPDVLFPDASPFHRGDTHRGFVSCWSFVSYVELERLGHAMQECGEQEGQEDENLSAQPGDAEEERPEVEERGAEKEHARKEEKEERGSEDGSEEDGSGGKGDRDGEEDSDCEKDNENSFSCAVTSLPSGWKLKQNVAGSLEYSSSELVKHHSIIFRSKRSDPGLSKELVTTSAFIIRLEVGESVDVESLRLRCFLVNAESLARIPNGLSNLHRTCTRNEKGCTYQFDFKIRVLSYYDNGASYRLALEPGEGDITILSPSFVTRARGCAGIYGRSGTSSPHSKRRKPESPKMMRKKPSRSRAKRVGESEIKLEGAPTQTCPLVHILSGSMHGDDVDSCVAMFLNIIKHMSKSEVDSLVTSLDRICGVGKNQCVS